MLKSMTGFGRAEATVGNKKITIEVKSLNSKGIDLNIKIPSLFRTQEMPIRTMLSQEVSRGKCDFYLSYNMIGAEQNHILNQDLLDKYYHDLKSFSDSKGIANTDKTDFLSILMKMPDALVSSKEELSQEDWRATEEIIKTAIQAYQEFRLEEGRSLFNDLTERIESIDTLLLQVLQYEGERIETVKDRIQKNLQDISEPKNIDQNRFEQELIYYLEKYDVSEEKVRLKAHLEHFIQTMNDDGDKGKKLGFIGQEIGREINTLGSKANHAEMQKLVVLMKDELERIKEQVLNVL
jgi:uncharacterized protein (TIGR00255 family)